MAANLEKEAFLHDLNVLLTDVMYHNNATTDDNVSMINPFRISFQSDKLGNLFDMCVTMHILK